MRISNEKCGIMWNFHIMRPHRSIALLLARLPHHEVWARSHYARPAFALLSAFMCSTVYYAFGARGNTLADPYLDAYRWHLKMLKCNPVCRVWMPQASASATATATAWKPFDWPSVRTTAPNACSQKLGLRLRDVLPLRMSYSSSKASETLSTACCLKRFAHLQTHTLNWCSAFYTRAQLFIFGINMNKKKIVQRILCVVFYSCAFKYITQTFFIWFHRIGL